SLLTVSFLVRGQTVTLVPSEIPLVVGIVFLRPVDLLLAAVVAQVITGLVKRRPPSKALFNVVTFACAAGAALITYRAILAGASPVALRGWAAAAAAVLVADILMLASVQSVVAVSARRWPRAASATAFGTTAAASPIAVVLVLTAVTAIWASRLAALLF